MRASIRKLYGFLRGTWARSPEKTCVQTAPEPSALSSVREGIAISEQVLFHAEKHCKLTEERYSSGKASERDLWDAREMLGRAKAFFLLSLYELDDKIDDLALKGR